MIKFGVPHFGLVPRLRWEGLGFAASSDPDRSESRGVIARSSPGALGTSQTQTLETPALLATFRAPRCRKGLIAQGDGGRVKNFRAS